MKKHILFILSLFILFAAVAATPVLAKPKDNGNNGRGQSNALGITKKAERQGENKPFAGTVVTLADVGGPSGATGATGVVLPTTSPTPVPTIPCDPNAQWKNHGEYVSCVAKLHLGGQAVSEAARSNVGKKSFLEPTGTPTVTPQGGSIIIAPIQNLETLWTNFLNFINLFRK